MNKKHKEHQSVIRHVSVRNRVVNGKNEHRSEKKRKSDQKKEE